ncbi:hypothetical protein BGAL_0138g00160 [Botrytis galanthina]|uniref:Uncharacterized protein n=1 Tax=Botrytis galanthina TaxID=278940 RepID=A0A4S8QZ58_9HELO|nr:hypothetical protein BGAL_0138g00160 [Botrytis galanthina]
MHRFRNFIPRSKLSKWSIKKLHQPSHLGASLSTTRFFTIDVDSEIPTKNNFEHDCLLKYQGRIHLPPKEFERVPAGQSLLCEMLPDAPEIISRKLSTEKWDKHVDKYSGELFITNNSEPFDRQSQILFGLQTKIREVAQKCVEMGITIEEQKQKSAKMEITVEGEKQKCVEMGITIEGEKQKSAEMEITIEEQKQKSAKMEITIEREKQKSAKTEITIEREKQKSAKMEITIEREKQKSAKLKTGWEKERQEINMGEFIKAKKFFSSLSRGRNRRKLSPQEEILAANRNRNAHRLDLLISIKQVTDTQYRDLNLGLVFEALYGISQEEVKHLLKLDKRCHRTFQVEKIVGYHGTLYARQIPSRFLQPFKQWLEGVRKVKSQIDDAVELAACQGRTATIISALNSSVDDKLLQEVKRSGRICKETYEDDNKQAAKRTNAHDEAIMTDLRERELLSKFKAIQVRQRKQDKLKRDSTSVDVDAETYSE